MNWTDLLERAVFPMTSAPSNESAPPVSATKMFEPLIEIVTTVALPLVIGVGIVAGLLQAVLSDRGSKHQRSDRPSSSTPKPSYTTTRLFTPAERAFLAALEEAVGQEYRIFGKVRIADVLTPRAQPFTRAHQVAFNRVSAKHLDFVLCDRTELTPVAAIELDDRSHARRDRIRRDELVDGACADARLPLVRQSARGRYDPEEIRRNVQAVLTGGRRPESAERTEAQDATELELEIDPKQGGVEAPVAVGETANTDLDVRG